MSKKETLTLSVAVLAFLLALPLVLVSGSPKPEVLEGEDRIAREQPVVAHASIDPTPPAAPGGAAAVAVARRDAPGERLPATEIVVWCDGPAVTVLGETLTSNLRCRLERARRRDVIEHVIMGRAGVGLVTIEPSENERRLGAVDVVIGAFEPVCVADPANPFRFLTRDQARAMLGGGETTWPHSREAVEIFGPGDGPRADLFAELLIPGDRLAVGHVRAGDAQVLRALRGRTHALGIVHRGVLPRDGSVQPIEIESFRPSLEVRIVFRNEYDPSCAALMRFWRSSAGRERLARVLTPR